MRILHVLAGVWQGSGIAEAVAGLSCELRAQGHEVAVAAIAGPLAQSMSTLQTAGGRVELFEPCFPYFCFYSFDMHQRLEAIVSNADVVHVHGCWTFPVWWACHVALKLRKPLVMTPHGCLDPVRLRYSLWRKRLAGIIDRYYLRRATVLHATSRDEAEAIVLYVGGKGKVRTVIIPNGVNADSFDFACDRDFWCGRFPSLCDRKILLYLGRLHPLKGLDLLISAWAEVKRSSKVLKCESAKVGGAADGGRRTEDGKAVGNRQSAIGNGESSRKDAKTQRVERSALMRDCESALVEEDVTDNRARPENSRTLELQNFRTSPWQLVIAGADEQGTLKRLQDQVRRLGLEDSVTFTGVLRGEERLKFMASANLFVLPTRSENFGIVVAEALACGVPVITTKGAPWSELMGSGESELSAICRGSELSEGRRGSAVRDAVTGMVTPKKLNTPNALNQLNALPPAANGRCGWWVDVGVEPLAEALREAMGLMDEERRTMGENGRRLVESKYRWETVAERMAEVYKKCVNAGLR